MLTTNIPKLNISAYHGYKKALREAWLTYVETYFGEDYKKHAPDALSYVVDTYSSPLNNSISETDSKSLINLLELIYSNRQTKADFSSSLRRVYDHTEAKDSLHNTFKSIVEDRLSLNETIVFLETDPTILSTFFTRNSRELFFLACDVKPDIAPKTFKAVHKAIFNTNAMHTFYQQTLDESTRGARILISAYAYIIRNLVDHIKNRDNLDDLFNTRAEQLDAFLAAGTISTWFETHTPAGHIPSKYTNESLVQLVNTHVERLNTIFKQEFPDEFKIYELFRNLSLLGTEISPADMIYQIKGANLEEVDAPAITFG